VSLTIEIAGNQGFLASSSYALIRVIDSEAQRSGPSLDCAARVTTRAPTGTAERNRADPVMRMLRSRADLMPEMQL